MTDQWVPAPPPIPNPPPGGIPLANSWNRSIPCPADANVGVVEGVVITGVPAVIGSVVNNNYAWTITLNDGQSPPNFSIDHYDASGELIDSPITISGVNGSVQFYNDVYLSHDPISPMEAATKEYVDNSLVVSQGVDTWNGRLGSVVMTSTDVMVALGYSPYDAANPNGYQTAGQVQAAINFAVPQPSNNNPGMDGVAAPGMANQWARWDHIHPSDSSKIGDAPNDGQIYGRQHQSWSPIVAPPVYTLPPATTMVLGGVKPDGTSIGVAVDGTISIISIPPSYVLPPATTTVLGGVKPDGTSIRATADGTISTVLVPMGDNRIINGDMRIDQRNNGASGTAIGYTCDRWQYSPTQASRGTWQRGSASLAPGFSYALTFTSSSAYSVVATDYFAFLQIIEADMVSDFAWGTANAQSVTLSFWAYSSLGGTFGGSIKNAAGTRSYPFTYSLSAAVWTKVAITIPGDTTGTWAMTGNAGSVQVTFGLGAGANFSGPAGAWAGANYVSATGAVSVVGTNGATFYVTGVKLEIGSVATPFNRQSLAKRLADCQRYYQTGQMLYQTYTGVASMTIGCSTNLLTSMRATPTVTPTNTSSNVTGLTAGPYNQSSVYFQGVSPATAGGASIGCTYTASAEL